MGKYTSMRDRLAVASHAEALIVFALWMREHGGAPAVDQIQQRFGCSRATAYRYRAAWAAAGDVPLEPPAKREHAPLLRFAAWAATQPRPPSKGQIREHLGVSESTARRWYLGWLRAISPQPDELPPCLGARIYDGTDNYLNHVE